MTSTLRDDATRCALVERLAREGRSMRYAARAIGMSVGAVSRYLRNVNLGQVERDDDERDQVRRRLARRLDHAYEHFALFGDRVSYLAFRDAQDAYERARSLSSRADAEDAN